MVAEEHYEGSLLRKMKSLGLYKIWSGYSNKLKMCSSKAVGCHSPDQLVGRKTSALLGLHTVHNKDVQVVLLPEVRSDLKWLLSLYFA